VFTACRALGVLPDFLRGRREGLRDRRAPVANSALPRASAAMSVAIMNLPVMASFAVVVLLCMVMWACIRRANMTLVRTGRGPNSLTSARGARRNRAGLRRRTPRGLRIWGPPFKASYLATRVVQMAGHTDTR
jgi:hypothetical protein